MASTNAAANLGTQTFVSEEWNARLLLELDPNLVFASPMVSNRNYEGDVSNRGDTVHINSLVSPTVSAYNDTTGLSPEQLSTVKQDLLIDQADSVAFYVGDAERIQAAGAFEAPAMRRAISGMATKMDKYVSGVIAAKATAGTLDLTAMTTPVAKGDAILEEIFDNMELLDAADISEAGRWVVVSPKAKRFLVRSSAVANAQAFNTGETVTANGVVARVAGFTILSTTAMPLGIDMISGQTDFVTVAHQFQGFRHMQVPTFRRDQIDGLSLYGAKVVRHVGLDTLAGDGISFDEAVASKGLIATTVTAL